MAALFSFLKQQQANPSNNNYRHRLFIIFLILSFLFWGVTKFSNTYTTQLTVSLNFVGVPDDVILSKSTETSALITVSASGFQLFWYGISPPKIDLYVKPALFDDQQKSTQIDLLEQQKLLEAQFGEGVILRAIRPLQVPVEYSFLTQKKLPLKLRNPPVFAMGYGLSKPLEITPDSIVVYGSQEDLDTLDVVYFDLHKTTPIQADFQGVADLAFAHENRKLNQKSIHYRGTVARYTEKTFEIPIVKSTTMDTIAVKLFPEKINVVFSLPLDKAGDVQPELFTFEVALDGIGERNQQTLDVRLTSSPDWVKNIRWEPKNVQFLIRK
jgi:hypothetical protein